jgi:hypothetical protein
MGGSTTGRTVAAADRCSRHRCLIHLRGPSGEPVVRLGMPLIDDYLEFLEARCRPNTVLAAAYDVKVFFTVVAKPRIGQGHLGASSSVDEQPQWLVEMSRKITGITSMRVRLDSQGSSVPEKWDTPS